MHNNQWRKQNAGQKPCSNTCLLCNLMQTIHQGVNEGISCFPACDKNQMQLGGD